MAIVDLKPEYIKRVSKSETFNPSKTVKHWVDTRATDPSNIEEYFVYSYYFRTVTGIQLGRFMLDKVDAALANVPPEGTKSTMGELPEPCRALKPGEKVTGIDPFGRVTVETPEDTPGASIDAKLDEILRLVKAILAGE